MPFDLGNKTLLAMFEREGLGERQVRACPGIRLPGGAQQFFQQVDSGCDELWKSVETIRIQPGERQIEWIWTQNVTGQTL